MDRETKQTFSQEDIQIVIGYVKRCTIVINIHLNGKKTQVRMTKSKGGTSKIC